jgi:hypothetical protein
VRVVSVYVVCNSRKKIITKRTSPPLRLPSRFFCCGRWCERPQQQQGSCSAPVMAPCMDQSGVWTQGTSGQAGKTVGRQTTTTQCPVSALISRAVGAVLPQPQRLPALMVNKRAEGFISHQVIGGLVIASSPRQLAIWGQSSCR